MKINALTKTTGLFGYPVEHSLSPDMHNAAFEAQGLNYRYLAFPVHPDSLNRAVEGIRAMNFRGVNVTIPHKEKVMLMLDEIDHEAEFIGAVNTVVNENGRLKGYNTDGRGFMKSLEENEITVDDKNICIVGAGGACRAVGYYLCRKASNVRLYDLDEKKADALVKDLKKLSDSVSPAREKDGMYTSDIIIHATPLGLKPDDPLPFDTDKLSPDHVIIDLIYKDTPLLIDAKRKGCRTVNGLGMLLWQGAIAFELWTGVAPPVEVMRKALLKGFKDKE